MDVTNVTQYPSRNVNTSITVKPGINANPILQSKQVVLIRSVPTYLRCIADQTRSKYDQPTLYRRPPRGTPAQHTTCGERDHPRPFFNRLKNLSRSPRPLRAGPTNPRCMLDQDTLSAIKARSLPIRPFFQSGRERGLVGSLVWTSRNVMIWENQSVLLERQTLQSSRCQCHCK